MRRIEKNVFSEQFSLEICSVDEQFTFLICENFAVGGSFMLCGNAITVKSVIMNDTKIVCAEINIRRASLGVARIVNGGTSLYF